MFSVEPSCQRPTTWRGILPAPSVAPTPSEATLPGEKQKSSGAGAVLHHEQLSKQLHKIYVRHHCHCTSLGKKYSTTSTSPRCTTTSLSSLASSQVVVCNLRVTRNQYSNVVFSPSLYVLQGDSSEVGKLAGSMARRGQK